MDAGAFMRIAIGIFFLLFGLGLAYMLLRLAGVLGEVGAMIRGTGEEVVPLLRRVQTTVDEVNANLSNVDEITEDVAGMTGALESTTVAVQAAVTTPINHRTGDFCQANQRISSLLKKPENSGMPASAAAPIRNVQ